MDLRDVKKWRISQEFNRSLLKRETTDVGDMLQGVMHQEASGYWMNSTIPELVAM